MKKRMTFLFVVTLIIGGLCCHAAAANIGYAVFRDKGWAIASNEHAGIVHTVSSGTPTYIIHHPGAVDLERLSLNEFIDGLPYHGAYYHGSYGQTKFDQIADLADEMLNDYVYPYLLTNQISLNYPASTLTSIEPEDIYKMRCDGLVEYCYEYFGVRVLGPSNAWNISNPDHFGDHCEIDDIYTPSDQRAALAATMP